MTLVKAKPVNRFPNLLDEFFTPDFFSQLSGNQMNFPAVNIKETDDAFTIELAAPGRRKEDFNIQIEKDVLSISSESRTEKSENEGKYSRREFGYNSFKRVFNMPENVDEENVKANYSVGVLYLTLPKTEKPNEMKRTITID